MDLKHGLVAQLGEHLICIQRVMGSNPISSTTEILTATLLKHSFWVRIVQMNLETFTAFTKRTASIRLMV